MKESMKTVAVAVLAFVAGGASLYGYNYVVAQRQQDANTSLEARVKEHLLDPDSAKCKKLWEVPEFSAICGEVNAKNRMGGYVGFRRFVLLTPGGIDFEPDAADPGDSTDARLKAVRKQLDFLREFEARCPVPGQAASGAAR